MLSLIIPNYNGAAYIRTLCSALLAQSLSKDCWELIFVDNGSDDDSVEIFKYLMEERANVVMFEEKKGSYSARNHGVSLSHGNVLVFTDSDCVPESEWLELIYQYFSNKADNVLVAGDVELFPSGLIYNCFEWFDKCAFLDQYEYSKSSTGATANLAISRNAYDQVGGFEEVFSGGDRAFCRKVIQNGNCDFSFQKNIKVRHPARSTRGAINKKLRRLGWATARQAYFSHNTLHKICYLVKTLVGLVLLPNQLRIALKTFKTFGFFSSFSWDFLCLVIGLGLYQRSCIITRYLMLWIGVKNLPND